MIVSDEPERLKWISKLNIILLFLHIGKEAKGDKYDPENNNRLYSNQV